MTIVRGKAPKITWGASFANTINFAYPVDEAVAFSDPREGAETIQAESGVEDAWISGDDQVLQGTVRWVPTVDGTGAYGLSQTGWDGTTGWRKFLEWARRKNVFRYYPDRTTSTYLTCYLVEPFKGAPKAESDFKRSFPFIIRTSDGSAFDGY